MSANHSAPPPSNAPGNVHAISTARERVLGTVGACDETLPPRQLGFSPIDALSLGSWASGDVSQLLEHARGLADALAGPDGDAVRLRLISKMLASARAQQAVLEAVLGECVARRDGEGMKIVRKVLKGVERRIDLLLVQHRIETRGNRAAVVVGQAFGLEIR